jgi:uncharacterized damage-inducible protein DinB
MINTRPAAGDYAPFYHAYVERVEGHDILAILENNKKDGLALLKALSEEQWRYSYAAGKWSIAEVILHIIDAERVFAYRALRIARGDQTPLPGFDQDFYVPNSAALSRSPESLIEEYHAVKNASIQLFEGFTKEMWSNSGTASDNTVSVLALAYIIVGHDMHHMKIIRERYL